MIQRAKRDVLTDNERTLEALFLQSRDLDELGQQLIQRITSDESGPSDRDIKAMVEILRAKGDSSRPIALATGDELAPVVGRR